MLDKKTDYRFVTQDALANVRIAGNPYLARSQKLVMLGEDVAFFEEAYRERYITAYNPLTGSNIERYSTRIRTIIQDTDEWYGRIKTFVSTFRWYERSKISQIQVLTNPVIVTDGDSGDRDDVLQAVEEIDSNCESAVSVKRQELEDYIGTWSREGVEATGQRKALEDALKAENERWDDGAEIRTIKAEYEDEVEALEQDLEEDLDEFKEDHLAAIQEIEESTELTDEEKQIEISKENDRYGIEVQKRENKFSSDVEEKRREMEKAIASEYKTHDDNIASARSTYESNVEEKTEEVNAYISDLYDTRDDSAMALFSTAYMTNYHLAVCAHSKTIRHRNEAFEGFIIRKSFADEFYRRNVLFRPSSTAMERISADIEHLDTFMLSDVVFKRYSHDETYVYDNGGRGVTSYVRDNEGIGRIIESKIHGSSEVGNGHMEYGNFDFYIQYGKREEADHVDHIEADILLEHSSSKNDDEGRMTICIQRKTFTRDPVIPVFTYVSRIDAINDELASDIEDVKDSWKEADELVESNYRAEIIRLQCLYDSAVANAKETLEEAKKSHQETFVQTLEANMIGWNDRLMDPDEDVKAVWREIDAAISNAKQTRKSADNVSQLRYNNAVSTAKDSKSEGERTAKSNRSSSILQNRNTYTAQIATLNSDAQDAIEEVYDDRSSAVLSIYDIYNAAVSAASNRKDREIAEAQTAARQAMMNKYPDREEFVDWKIESGEVVIINTRGQWWDQDFVDDVNDTLSLAIYESRVRYNDSVHAAEYSRNRSLSDLPQIDLNRRIRFKASIVPMDGDTYQYINSVRVIGIDNVAVYLNPATKTNADISDYVEEMWSDDQSE